MVSEKMVFVITIFLILIIFISIIFISINVMKVKENFTGHATGYVNISIVTSLAIELHNFTIDWKAGSIDSEENNATLYTDGDNDGIVLRGNWSGVNVTGCTLENIGSVNASIYIETNRDAQDMFNGTSGTNEQYQIKISNKETNACVGNTDVWIDVNKTNKGTKYCDNFNYLGSNDEAYIDILLTVPYDVNNLGLQQDIITVVADVVG